jgi:cytochrome c
MRFNQLYIIIVFLILFTGCSKRHIGIGPVQNLELTDTIDKHLSAEGRNYFMGKCYNCHKLESTLKCPKFAGVTEKRKPEWIMNYMLNTEEMNQNDVIAKEVMSNYLSDMKHPLVSEYEARAILEYLRDFDFNN